MFFKAGRSRPDHGLLWPPPRPVVDLTVQPWQVASPKILGSDHREMPVVTLFSVVSLKRCISLYLLMFVPAYSIQIRCLFRHFQASIYRR